MASGGKHTGVDPSGSTVWFSNTGMNNLISHSLNNINI